MNVALLLSLSSGPAWAKREQLTVEQQYELGLKYMNRGYYTKALDEFTRIRNYHRDDPLSVKAELAIADLHYQKSEWDQARLAYEDFMRMHPRHPDLDYVVYRIGLTLDKKAPKVAARDQTWTVQTVDTWTGFDSRFPDSEYSTEVAERLAKARERLAQKELVIAEFYQRRHAWKAVRGRLAGLIERYPDADCAPEALEGWALAAAHLGRPDEVTQAVEMLAKHDPARSERLHARVADIEADPPNMIARRRGP